MQKETQWPMAMLHNLTRRYAQSVNGGFLLVYEIYLKVFQFGRGEMAANTASTYLVYRGLWKEADHSLGFREGFTSCLALNKVMNKRSVYFYTFNFF